MYRMRWMSMCIVQSVFLGTILAATMQQCPQKSTQTDFNMTMYAGEWHEILRIPNSMEVGYSCMLDRFTLSPEGIMNVHSHAYNASNGVYVSLEGTATASTTQPGRFDITYRGNTQIRRPRRNAIYPLSPEEMSLYIPISSKWDKPDKPTVWSSSYWVLGTDYDNYVVLWGCLVEENGTIRPLSWVSSRQNTMSEDSMRHVEAIFTQNGLNSDQYEAVTHTDCPSMSTT